MIKIKVRGVKRIINRVNSRINRFQKQLPQFAERFLRPIVEEIKSNVVRDTINEGGYSHVFTGDLLRSVGSRITQTADGIKVTFGYFIDYGLDLERGSDPEVISIPKFREYLKQKTSNDDQLFIRARGLRQKVKDSGSRAYPIIVPVWNNNKAEYVRQIFEKVDQLWR